MKIKLNSDDDLALSKTLEICTMITCYPQIFLDESLYKL